MKYKFNKIFLILILSISCVVYCKSTNFGFVNAKSPIFAQIKNSNTILYKSVESNQNINNSWCVLEQSYFVKILSNNDSTYYKVEYNGVTGYVLKSSLQLINETPSNPYPIVTFNVPYNCYLRSTPNSKDTIDNTIIKIPSNTKNLKYIGKVVGEEAVDFKGSIWYLTDYNGTIGYVYSAYTTSISPISVNVEKVTYYDSETFGKVNPLTNSQCLLIITITLIPTIIILVLLYKPVKGKKLKTVRKSIPVEETFDENL